MNGTTNQQANVITLYSASEVARAANLPGPRFAKLIACGEVVAPYRQGKTHLFTVECSNAIKTKYAK